MLVTKEFTFDAAHYLPNYHGKCEKMHGHTYTMQITVSAPLDPKTGIAFDFVKIKDIVQQKVLSKFDHSLLNDILEHPSAENIAILVWKTLKKDLPLFEIKIWETATSFVTYHGEESDNL